MTDTKLYDSFSEEEMKKYSKEAKERWGNTEAYKQSQEKMKKMSQADIMRIKKESDDLMKEIVLHMPDGATSTMVQNLIAMHYNNLGHWYTPNLQIYAGLAKMYVADARFTEYFERYQKGLAQFMHDAMLYYVAAEKAKK